MRHSLPARIRWHADIGRVDPPAALSSWLKDPASLTAKLTASCSEFRIRLLREEAGRGLGGESQTIGLTRSAPVWQREVLLECDGEPVVYARTVVSCDRLPEWPWLHDLGENSLGAALFSDSRVVRGAMRFAALKDAHPVRRALPSACSNHNAQALLYARRSKFEFNRNRLLITEVFLPPIMQLTKNEPSV